MRARRLSKVILRLCLVAVCAAALDRLYTEWHLLQSPAETVHPPSTPASASQASVPATAMSQPPIDAYSVVLERPLFSPTRRPPEPLPPEPPLVPELAHSAAPEAPPPPLEPAFLLVGTVVDRSARIALVRSLNNGQVIQLREGQEVEGWTVLLVEADRAFFRNSGVEREMLLDFTSAPSPDLQPPPVSQ
jgi:hypothetical protein